MGRLAERGPHGPRNLRRVLPVPPAGTGWRRTTLRAQLARFCNRLWPMGKASVELFLRDRLPEIAAL